LINYHKEFVSALETILPTHYEMALTSKTATPCISYMETNNYAIDSGDTLGYSRITYQVKVWGNKIATLQEYALKIDEALRPLGFKRVSSRELYDNQSTMIQKIMNYECLALEQFK
jgi:hypothetical protein